MKSWARLLGIVAICATFITAPVVIPDVLGLSTALSEYGAEAETVCDGPHTFTIKVPYITCETLCMGCSWDENGNWNGCGCVQMAECIC